MLEFEPMNRKAIVSIAMTNSGLKGPTHHKVARATPAPANAPTNQVKWWP